MTINLALLIITGALSWFFWEKRQRRSHSVAPGLHAKITLPHTGEFELYHNALSLCSMKTRVCLAELQIPYTSHPVDLIETGRYETIGRPFLAVNPAGTVPVLVHRGHPIYESHEQIRYAAAHAPAGSPSLIPDDPAARREMEYWIDRSSITDDPMNQGEASAGNAVPPLTFPLFATMMERVPAYKVIEGLLFHYDIRRPILFLTLKLAGIERMPHITPLSKFISRSRQQLDQHLDALEAQLTIHSGPWILGERFSLADVSWLVILERLKQADYSARFLGGDRRPAVTEYWRQLQARPAYTQAIIHHSHPLITYGTQRLQQAKSNNDKLCEFLLGPTTER